MILQRRGFTAGDKRQVTVSYDVFLPLASTLVTATVTCPDTSVTISGGPTIIVASSRKVQFFVAGGTAGVLFTVTVQVVDSDGQIVTDTIEFSVNAP